jgi:SET domain-containing protein
LVYIQAIRYIKRGEEITIPYSFVYWLNENISKEKWLYQIFTNLSPSQRKIVQECWAEQFPDEGKKIFNISNDEFDLFMKLYEKRLLKGNCIIKSNR